MRVPYIGPTAGYLAYTARSNSYLSLNANVPGGAGPMIYEPELMVLS
jgi:hypothetical protein